MALDMENSDASSTAAARNLVSFYFLAPKILLLLAPEPWRSTKRNSMFREAAMNTRTCSTSRRTYIVDVNANLMSNTGSACAITRARLMIKCLAIIQMELEFGNDGF